MPRCSNCNKWVTLDTESEPESSLQLDGDQVTGSVDIVNLCGECSTALKQTTFDVDVNLGIDFDHECEERNAFKENPEENDEPEFELEVELERTERRDPPRAKRQRTLYGYKGTVRAKCECGYESNPVEIKDEVQASHMDDA